MRDIATDPEAIAYALEYAKTHPDFWIKCYEAGFGRPPQAVKIQGGFAPLQHIVQLSDGNALSPTVAGLPTSDSAKQG